VSFKPECFYFKPRGVPLKSLQEIVVGLDELEALRLADYEGMYQEEAAVRMDVSRQTFARVVQSARRKVAEALVEGKALKLEGGRVMFAGARRFKCYNCQHSLQATHGTGRPASCPRCNSKNFHLIAKRRSHNKGEGF
jgi:predicted DNA-binding protein (UPF0251 family)/DNA-directed RNA polymerase subunit RPC12/RpoP